MSTPDVLKVLKERFAEEAGKLGLTLRQFEVLVGNEGDEDYLRTVCTIEWEAIGKTVDQVKDEADFADLERSFREQDRKDKVTETRDSLAALLNPKEDDA